MTVSVAEDWIAIRELTARYNRALDDSRADDWVDTFLESGGLYVAGTDDRWVGKTALMTFVSSKPWGSMHLTVDPEIQVDGDIARQVCSLIMVRRSPNRTAPVLMTTGRYDDVLSRTLQGWRFDKRVVFLDASITSPGN